MAAPNLPTHHVSKLNIHFFSSFYVISIYYIWLESGYLDNLSHALAELKSIYSCSINSFKLTVNWTVNLKTKINLIARHVSFYIGKMEGHIGKNGGKWGVHRSMEGFKKCHLTSECNWALHEALQTWSKYISQLKAQK